jgi:hypothetical protein
VKRLLEQLEGDRGDERAGGKGEETRRDLTGRGTPSADPATDRQRAGGDDCEEDGLLDGLTLPPYACNMRLSNGVSAQPAELKSPM